MRLYIFLGLGIIFAGGGVFLYLLGANVIGLVDSGQLQMEAIRQGKVLAPYQIDSIRSAAMWYEVWGAIAVVVGIAFAVVALATRPKN